MAGSTTLQDLQQRLRLLEDERSKTWDAHWQELVEYLMPRRGRFIGKGQKPNEGEKRHDKIIDSTATQSLRMLAAGMQGGLTSPSRPWFRLGLEDTALMELGPVKDWLSDCESRIYHALSRSDFYASVHSLYIEQCTFGTGVMLILDGQDKLHFPVLTIGEFALGTDNYGQVDTLYRRIWMTARQMEQQWGKGARTDGVQAALEINPFQWVQVVHVLEPNRKRTPGKADAAGMAYTSTYFELDGTKPLAVGGYEEQPFVAVRWDTSGHDSYGRSPGMDVLGDVKMLQEMSKCQLRAIHKMIDPPMAVPRQYQSTLNLLPGGVNYVDPNASGDFVKPIYQITPDIKDMEAKLEQVRASIRGGFYNDLFMTGMDNPNMTATEVAERHAEKMLLLGPIIERMQSELLDPLIQRTFMILIRQGRLQPAPQELAGQEMRVEYVSMLAQAQRAVATQSIQQLVNFVGQVAQMAPGALDKINVDAAVDAYATAVGSPADMVLPDDQVAEMRQARAQQQQMAEQQMQQQTQQAQQMGAISTLGGISTDKPNMLTDVAQGLGLDIGAKRQEAVQ